MKKYSTEILNIIKSITNKGPKDLHVPFFTGHEKYFLNKCISTGVVSTIGNYVNIFEKNYKNYQIEIYSCSKFRYISPTSRINSC